MAPNVCSTKKMLGPGETLRAGITPILPTAVIDDILFSEGGGGFAFARNVYSSSAASVFLPDTRGVEGGRVPSPRAYCSSVPVFSLDSACVG